MADAALVATATAAAALVEPFYAARDAAVEGAQTEVDDAKVTEADLLGGDHRTRRGALSTATKAVRAAEKVLKKKKRV